MPLDFEEQFSSISIPMHSTNERPAFMSPKPTSPKRSPLPSALGKRDFIIAFGDDAEEQRYGQKIDGDFFATNVGHGVFSAKSEQKPLVQAATDSVIEDFRAEFFGVQRRERDSESKYDIDEIIEWCDYYRNNRNLFNV